MKNTNILFEVLFKELIDNNKTCKINLDYKHRLEKLATHSHDFSHELVATYVNTKT